MKQLLTLLTFLIISLGSFAQTPLAIVTGFNEGGPDGVAIALAEDLPAGTRIYLTTEEYQAGQFKFADNTTGTVDEFVGYWESPTEVPEGMVMGISEIAPNVFSTECNSTGWFTFGVDCGSFTAVSGDFDINQEQEIYLYSDNDSDPGNGITQMHSALYLNFAGNKAFPANNNPGTPTGDYPYTFDVDSIPNVTNPVKRFSNLNGSGRYTNHIRAFLQRPSRWNQNDSFLDITKLDTARFLEINLNYCAFSTDTDGDLICDYDPQNVGIYTPDNCINTFNPDQADLDGDGIGDVCDPVNNNDSDSDGIDDTMDNCPSIANPGQEDLDGDGIGDVCDDCSVIVSYITNVVAESCDGASDGEFQLVAAGGSGTWDFSKDNGTTWQAQTGSAGYNFINLGSGSYNVKVRDANNPTCVSATEVFVLSNNGPCDSDGDGVNDDVDNCPSIANAGQEDTDLDGMGDACDGDDDNDGVVDGIDNCPNNANPGQEDLDGDGIGDVCDDCSVIVSYITNVVNESCDGASDGEFLLVAAGGSGTWDFSKDNGTTWQSQIGSSGYTFINLGSGSYNVKVRDANNPTCVSATEVFVLSNNGPCDSDGDGVNDDVDNCPSIANAGQEDTDLDGMGDACDDDDDNDGILDVNDNCPLSANAGQEDIDSDGIGDDCDPSLDIQAVVQNGTNYINTLGVNNGQKNSLTIKLNLALTKYCNGDLVDALDKLTQFISKVQDHSNKGKISTADEAYLVGLAQAMIDAMNAGTVDCPVARISSTQNLIELELFPNPTSGQLNIHFTLPENEFAEISIIDLTGRVVYTKEMIVGEQKLKIDLSPNLANGQYFVKLTSSFGIATKKLILNR